MNESRRRSDITQQETKDKTEVEKESKRAEKVVEDGGKIEKAGKDITLKGTEEGAADIKNKVSRAMEGTKDVHKKQSVELDKKFEKIKETEKNLEQRSGEMEKDSKKITSELGAMSSADTKSAQADMREAAAKAQEDSKFLDDFSKKEKHTRETGQTEIKKQKDKIGKMNVRK